MPNLRPVISSSEDIRKQIHSKVKQEIANKFPITSGDYTADISNIEIQEKSIPYNQQRDLVLTKGSLNDGLYADVKITDKSGKTVGQLKKHRLINVPHYTPRNTMMVDGNEYSVINQLRTKSGVYTRVRGNEELESSFNLAKGSNFKLIMTPDTGVFKVHMRGSSVPMYPMLKILGAQDNEIERALGRELFVKNSSVSQAQIDRTRNVLFEKLAKSKSELGDTASNEEKESAIRAYFLDTEMDPETTKITLGTSYSRVSYSTILDAARKILSVYNDEGDIDERDNLEFQKMFSVEDIIGEVLQKNTEAVNKIKMKLKGIPQEGTPEEIGKYLKNTFSTGVFSKPISNFITSSSISRLPSQINPVEMLTSPAAITRLGEGAIGDERAVPDETRSINYSYMGVIDPIATPESSKVGIDNYASMYAMKSDDNEIYKQVKNIKTGQKENLRAIDLYDKHVGMPREKYKGAPKKSEIVPAVHKGKLVKVPYSKLDYIIPSPDHLITTTTGVVPFGNAAQANRVVMADKHVQQSMPLKDPDNRLVEAVNSEGRSMSELLGTGMNVRAPFDGTVTKIDDDYIHIKGKDGKVEKLEYVQNFPLASKTFLDHRVSVEAGQKVKKDQIVAESNFSKNNKLANGRNLKVAYMPYEGLNHEDGIVVSESAAQKMTSVHSDRIVVQLDKSNTLNKDKYTQIFPTLFSKAQLDKLDADGIVKKGVTLEFGDPLILLLEDNSDSRVNQVLGKLHKSLIQPYRDAAKVYEDTKPGEVLEAKRKGNIISVLLKTEKPLELGDKLTGTYGNKGIVTKLLPDDEMPQGEDGPLEILFTPAGIPSRINPNQVLESALGKISAKTGKTYNVENFSKDNYIDFVKEELKKHKVKDKEDLTDPITGKKIPGIFTGVQHILKGFKTTDTNFAARGIEGAYDQDETPAGSGVMGPKGIGGMEINALLGHNARNFLYESSTIRSSKNSEFWKSFQEGRVPHLPTEKRTFDRFITTLKQAGVNVTKEGDNFVAAPLTDKDIKKLSSGEIKEATRLNAKDLRPEKGGLFDESVTGGMDGDRWAHVELSEPVINPMFEDCVRHILGITTKQLKDKYIKEGGDALKKELNKIDVAAELSSIEKELDGGKLKGADLDKAIKKMKYLRALKDRDLKVGEAYMLKNMPIIPPKMRPISVGKTGDLMENDSNYLLRDLILQNNSAKEAKKYDLDPEDNRKALYDRVREVTGVMAPEATQLQAKNVKGALEFIKGDAPKHGYFQKKVMYSKQNLSGRGTIAPDPSLGLDEIGLPEDMAWNMYKPFLIREMSKRGYSMFKAREEIENRSEMARKILSDEMENRPVVFNRAPSLWRHSIMSAKPVLRPGKTIHVNSLWEKATNQDYDGDCATLHVPITPEATEDAKNMFPSKQVFSDKSRNSMLMVPTAEPIAGLYKATKNLGKTITGKAHKFKTVEAAWKAYYDGSLKMTDLVEIG